MKHPLQWASSGGKSSKSKHPRKIEARRSECYNGLLFPPERTQSNIGLRRRKDFLKIFFNTSIHSAHLIKNWFQPDTLFKIFLYESRLSKRTS
jgi:hypothetical protein